MIVVAGHSGMVGAAIARLLLNNGHLQGQVVTRTHAEIDLTNHVAIRAPCIHVLPQEVYLAAARVGGIRANDGYPAEFI